MARPLRVEFPDALYHVTGRGIEKKSIFSEKGDKYKLLERMAAVHERYGFVFHAYCIMSNHYHLLIETPLGNISQGMQNLNSTYARWYNEDHDRCGPVFQGRFGSFLVEKEDYLLTAARYIVLNPVRAGIAGNASSYAWSSMRDMMGKRRCPEFLDTSTILECFSLDLSAARRSFRSFVAQGIDEDEPDYLEKGPVFGSEQFMKAAEEQVAASGRARQKEISRKERFFNRPDLGEIFKEPFARHFRDVRNARIAEAFREFGYSQREIGDFLGLHCSTVSNIVRAEEELDGKLW